MGTNKTPEKKSIPRTKADTLKSKVTKKKSSVVKKELEPLTASEVKKTEKKSVTLLKEAINNAKTKALDNEVTAKPVNKRVATVKKTIPTQSDVVKEKTQESPKETKATYTKSDIVKPKEYSKPVILEKAVDIKIDDSIKLENTSTTDNSIYKKESIPSILSRDNNLENSEEENKEDLLKESIRNLQEKIKAKQEEELNNNNKNLETKNTIDYFREKAIIDSPKVENIVKDIDTKPSKPASAPPYSYTQYMKTEKKKSKKPFILILGIILAVAGISFGIFKFVLNKENTGDDTPMNAYVEVEELVEVTEGATTDTESIIVPTSVLEQTDSTETVLEQEEVVQETPKVERIVEEATPKVNEVENATIVETPPTPVAPKAPATPTAPKVTPPTFKAPTKPYVIAWKDTLQSIAINELGDIRHWPTIYSLNKDILNSPDSYQFGTTLYIPINKIDIENMSETGKASLYNDYLVTIEAYKRNNNAGMVIVLERIAATLK